MPSPRTLLSAVVCAGALVATTVSAASASAATPAAPRGDVMSAQDTFTHTLRVTGYAYDATRPSASVSVRVYADGHFVGQVRADRPSAAINRAHKFTGKHVFLLTVSRATTTRTVSVRSTGLATTAPLRTLASSRTTHHQPTAAQRVITVAKRYVGKARYHAGGASPRSGFDCSGYTRYVFATAHAGSLTHSAEQQRRSTHAVSAHDARAGDLVFYGVPAYHVAIYAGHGMQYAATTDRGGIRYQQVWSSSVQYRRVG